MVLKTIKYFSQSVHLNKLIENEKTKKETWLLPTKLVIAPNLLPTKKNLVMPTTNNYKRNYLFYIYPSDSQERDGGADT